MAPRLTPGHDVIGTRAIFFVEEEPPLERLHAERPQEIGGHARPRNELRLPASGQREPGGPERGQLLEGDGLAAPPHELRGVHRHCRIHVRDLSDDAADDNESIGLVIGERPQQDTVDDREDRGVGADAERDAGHDDEAETAALADRARRVAHVLRQVIEGREAARFAAGFGRFGEVAEAAKRGVTGVVRGKAAADVLVDQQIEMAADLLARVTLAASSPERGAQPCRERAQRRHTSPGFRKRASRWAICSHRSVSATRCFRPRAVSA